MVAGVGNGGVLLGAVGAALAAQSALVLAAWQPWSVAVALCLLGWATLGFPAASGLIFDHVDQAEVTKALQR